jgi:outer membrane protein insertion porin family
VELVSPHRLPEERVRSLLAELEGRPLSRSAVRASLDRLWALGLFAEIQVDEIAEPGGVRLRYRLTRRALIRRVSWEGDAGLDPADLAAAAGLAIGEDATPERLARARRDLLARYRAEGFLGARVELRVEPVAATNERDVTLQLAPGARVRLGDVRIRGEAGLAQAELTQALGLREGDPYREARVRDAARAAEDRLRAEGFFGARVTIGAPAWQQAQARVDLTVEVAAGPRVLVEFEGNAAVQEPELRARLTFGVSGVVDEFETRASARQLEALYRERGHHFVEVEGADAAGSQERAIRFRIREGPRVVVESVAFEGNRDLTDGRLRAEMETRPPAFLHRGLYRAEVLDRDLRVLLAFLRSQGFADARIGPADVRFSDDRSRARVAIPIQEGPRLTVGAVTVEGQEAVAQEALRAALPLRSGAWWSDALAEDGRRAIERLYADRGRPAATAAVDSARRGTVVDVRYRIREGEPEQVARVLVRGLVLTRLEVVERTLPFRPGDPLLPERLLEGQRRLAELPAFEAIGVEPSRNAAGPFADVLVTLRERKPWRADFGLGYGNEDGARGFLELGHDNLFGTGRSVLIREKASAGGQKTGFAERTELVYREPWLLGTPWSADATLLRERRDEIGYSLERYGLAVGVQRDLPPVPLAGLHGAVRYRLDHVNRFDVDATLAAADVRPGTERVASLTPILTLDRRDDRLDPRRGSFHLASVEAAGVPVGSEVAFLKARLETSWAVPWPPPTVLALSGRLGLATPLGDTTALPIEDRFFAGGGSSVRGFRENRIGPRDAAGNPVGGNALVVLNLEWRFPIWRWIGGALFVDTGAVTPEVGDLELGAFRTGAGAGLRVATPVGPVRVDLGYALQPLPGESRLQVYLTVGNPF